MNYIFLSYSRGMVVGEKLFGQRIMEFDRISLPFAKLDNHKIFRNKDNSYCHANSSMAKNCPRLRFATSIVEQI